MAFSERHTGKMLVPWFNRNEWIYVQDLIYVDSTNEENQQKALKILRIWKIRMPKLPGGVEGTLTILEALLVNKETTTKYNLRVIQGAAILRFLNLCCGQNEKQGTFYKSAQKNNIPEWLINLRHDIAHGQIIASERLLSYSLIFCLNWLDTNYWKPQSLTLKDFVSKVQHNDTIIVLINLYCKINLLYNRYKSSPVMNCIDDIASKDYELSEEIAKHKNIVNFTPDLKLNTALNKLEKLITKCIESGNKREIGEIISKTLITNECIFAAHTFKVNDMSLFFPIFLFIWDDIVKVLFLNGILFSFLKELLQVNNSYEYEDDLKKFASLWVKYICETLLVYKSKFDYKKCETILKDIETLRTDIIHNPGTFTSNFLEIFLKLCNYTSEDIEATKLVMETYQLTDEINSQSLPHTQDIEMLNNFLMPKYNGVDTSIKDNPEIISNHKFRVIEDTSIFEGCPLGVLAFQNREINPWLFSQ